MLKLISILLLFSLSFEVFAITKLAKGVFMVERQGVQTTYRSDPFGNLRADPLPFTRQGATQLDSKHSVSIAGEYISKYDLPMAAGKNLPTVLTSAPISAADIATGVVGLMGKANLLGFGLLAGGALIDYLSKDNIAQDLASPSGLSGQTGGYTYRLSQWDCTNKKSAQEVGDCYSKNYYDMNNCANNYQEQFCPVGSTVLSEGATTFTFRANGSSSFTNVLTGQKLGTSPVLSPLSESQAIAQLTPPAPNQIGPIVKDLLDKDPSGQSLPEPKAPFTLSIPSLNNPFGDFAPDPDLIFNPDGSISYKQPPVQTVQPDGTIREETKDIITTQTLPDAITQTENTTTKLTSPTGDITEITTQNAPPLPYTPPSPVTPITDTTSSSDTADLCALHPDILACEKVQPVVPPPFEPDTDLYFPFMDAPIELPDWNASDFLPTLPSPTCTYEVHRTWMGHNFDIAPCEPLQPLRAVLAWVFGVLTAWICFRIFFKTTS